MQWSSDLLRCRHRPKSQYARKMDLQRGATMMRLGTQRCIGRHLRSRAAFVGNSTSASPSQGMGPPETPVIYKAEDAQWGVAQLSSGKAGPCIRSGGPDDQDKCVGAVAEQWKTVDSVRRLQYRLVHRPLQQHGQRLRLQAVFVPQEDEDAEIAFLPKPGKRPWGCKKLENCPVARPHWPGLGKSISTSTCASSRKGCRPMPVWLAPRKEHARCNIHPGKRVREIHQLESPSMSPQLSPRRFLV